MLEVIYVYQCHKDSVEVYIGWQLAKIIGETITNDLELNCIFEDIVYDITQ